MIGHEETSHSKLKLVYQNTSINMSKSLEDNIVNKLMYSDF